MKKIPSFHYPFFLSLHAFAIYPNYALWFPRKASKAVCIANEISELNKTPPKKKEEKKKKNDVSFVNMILMIQFRFQPKEGCANGKMANVSVLAQA